MPAASPVAPSGSDGGEDLSPWIKAIAVVTFDVELGQVMELSYPSTTLSEGVRKKVCCLSLPDSNSGQNGDVQFSMRVRCSDLPLTAPGTASAVPADHSFLYASVFFRQIIDSSLQRGYFQKSVVLLSYYPFTNLLHECARVVGPLFFEFGDEVLDAVSANIKSWPPLRDGYAYELPLAGTMINFRVPSGAISANNVGGVEGVLSDPTARRDDTVSDANEETPLQRASSAMQQQQQQPRSTTTQHEGSGGSSGGGLGGGIASAIDDDDTRGSSSPGKKWIRRRSESLRSTNSVASAPATEGEEARLIEMDDHPADGDLTEGSLEDAEISQQLSIGEGATSQHAQADSNVGTQSGHGARGGTREAERPVAWAVGETGETNDDADLENGIGAGAGAGAGVGVGAAVGGEGMRDGEFSISDIFDARAHESPGLFQEVRLFSTFGGLSVALWHIWELAITGEPIIVLAPTPDSCSQAVLAVASLVAPMTYQGDFRPYFTIYDPDFRAISKRHNQLRGQQMPACVLGVTNP
jgi:hypothetical protein